MLFNDRRKQMKAGRAERAQVHAVASQDINPFVSRKEKYASAARAVDAAPKAKKSPSALSQKIAKKMYPAGIPKTPSKGGM